MHRFLSRDRALFASALAGVVLLAFPAAGCAQAPIEKAWNILNLGTESGDIEKRMSAVSALGLIARNEQAEEMATHAMKDVKPEVRAVAATALGEMQATGAVPLLRRALKDPDVSVVLASAHSLLALKDKSGYEVYYAILSGNLKGGGGLLAEQRKMLDDPRKMAAFGFQTGVGFIPFGGLGLTAFRMLTKDDASQVRAASAKILADDPDPRSAEALVVAASDKSWLVRAAACDAIGRRGERSLASKIEAQLDDEKPVVQYTAAAAILHLETMPPPKTRARR
jgi:HEAT repeat protein